MTNADTLRGVLGSQTDDKSVHAQALLKLILSSPQDEKIELLSIILLELNTVTKTPSNLPNKGIDDGIWEQLSKTHSDMIRGHLKMAFCKTHSIHDFSAEILRLIDFFIEEDEKTFVLARVMYSPYVPYQQLPGVPVQMNSAEYRHKLESDKKRVQLVDYIIDLPFDERTERSSMLLQVIDDTADKSLRVALLAHAHYKLEKNIEKKHKRD